ncbi:hypothetical protein C8A03DRAFT_30547 [Achaetomium macrosporum]|uniref:Uncharacterized protein n=1 Tax=Achaetomium macrosporum TaxID=79813 RepID=A0AAN7CGG2_9PEZI|nr:hypothetical protein C8A03DRAFT_30547 [Achaetomium macrosporum]
MPELGPVQLLTGGSPRRASIHQGVVSKPPKNMIYLRVLIFTTERIWLVSWILTSMTNLQHYAQRALVLAMILSHSAVVGIMGDGTMNRAQVTMSVRTSSGGSSPGGTGGSHGGEGCGGTSVPQIVVEQASDGACSAVSPAAAPAPARSAFLPPLRPPPVAPRPFKFTIPVPADQEGGHPRHDDGLGARGVPPSATEPSQHDAGIGVRRIPASRTEAARHGGIWDDRFIPVTQLAPSAGHLPPSQTAGLLNPLRMHPTTLSRSPSTPLTVGDEDPAAGVRLHGNPPLVDRKVLEKTQRMLAAHQALKGDGQPPASSLRPRPSTDDDARPKGLLRKVSSLFSKKKDAPPSIKAHEIRHLTGSLSSLELSQPPARRVRDTQIRLNEADNVKKREKAVKVLGETPQLAPVQRGLVRPQKTAPAEATSSDPPPAPQPPITDSDKQPGSNAAEELPATPKIATPAEEDPFSGPSPRPTDFEKRLQATAAAQDSPVPTQPQYPEYPPPGWI